MVVRRNERFQWRGKVLRTRYRVVEIREEMVLRSLPNYQAKDHITRSADCHFVPFHLSAIRGKSTESNCWSRASCHNYNADLAAQADDCGNANTGTAANTDTYANTIGLGLPDKVYVRIRDDCHYESFIVIRLLPSLSGKNRKSA